MSEQKTGLDIWAIVELFGHQRIAGRCSEENIAGNNMLRIDVPETTNNPAFTRFLNHAAIYAINPVTEEVATMSAGTIAAKPIEPWSIKEWQKKYLENEGKKQFELAIDLPPESEAGY